MKEALIIVDIQNDYFSGGKNPLINADDACRVAKSLLDDFRRRGLPVYFIRHISTRPGSTFFLPDTVGSEIHKLLQPHEGECVIIKNFPNSFYKTNLLDLLTRDKVTDLLVCGMMTHMCIDSTIRAGKDLGFNIKLISDACATKDLLYDGKAVTAENVNISFFSSLNGYFATVLTYENYSDK